MVKECPSCKKPCLDIYIFKGLNKEYVDNPRCSSCMSRHFFYLSEYEGKEIYGDIGKVGLITKE